METSAVNQIKPFLGVISNDPYLRNTTNAQVMGWLAAFIKPGSIPVAMTKLWAALDDVYNEALAKGKTTGLDCGEAYKQEWVLDFDTVLTGRLVVTICHVSKTHTLMLNVIK